MSNKTKTTAEKAGSGAFIRSRGNSKSGLVLRQIGQRNSKFAAQVLITAFDESSVYPPVTAEEAEAFCRIHTKRCNMNLANAKDRGDKRAVINLERKLAVYQYLYKLVKERSADMATTSDCPHCMVHSVNKDGVCACCGKHLEEDVL